MVVSTYQAASGGGAPAMAELYDQTKEFLDGKSDDELTVSAFQHRIAFNCIPHIDKFLEDDSTKEEWKMVVETKKIMGDQDIRVAATCVRVPVLRCHAEAVYVEFQDEVSVEARARRSRRSRASWSWTTAPRTRIPCRVCWPARTRRMSVVCAETTRLITAWPCGWSLTRSARARPERRANRPAAAAVRRSGHRACSGGRLRAAAVRWETFASEGGDAQRSEVLDLCALLPRKSTISPMSLSYVHPENTRFG